MDYEIVIGIIVLVIIVSVICKTVWKSVGEELDREGSGQWQTPRPRRNGKGEGRGIWGVSLKGNPTVVIDGKRITVFASDEGWKYVIADEIARDDDEYELPDFSLPYETEEEAKYEALAFIDDRPSRYRSITEQRAEWSDKQWSEHKGQRAIQEREQLIADISDLLTREDLNVTALRKPERKIASRLKALEWQISEYQDDGVRAGLIARAERQKNTLRKLAQRVEERIAERKAKRKSSPQK